MFSSTLKRSVGTLGVVAGLLAAAGPASADSTTYPAFSPLAIASSEVLELNTFGGDDTLTGDDGRHPGVRSRGPIGAELKSDGNEVVIESLTAKTLASVDRRASLSREPVTSLGRENSIEA